MKWLPGGWQRDEVDRNRGTVPAGDDPGTMRYGPEPATRAQGPARQDRESGPSPLLAADARDVDVSAHSFRNLLIGGGVSGFLVVLCAATIVNKGSSVGVWIWQLIFGVLFLWFAASARGMLNSRGFLFDRSGFYARTKGEIVGVGWEEISAIGVGSLPWIQHKRPVHPERRQALEVYPVDPRFPERHPELDRWRIDEPAPMPGLPALRYRFHLPPFNRLPRFLENAVQKVAPRKWVGHYRRQLPPPQ